MRKKTNWLFIVFLSFFFFQCNEKKQSGNNSGLEEQEVNNIDIENKKVREEARKLQFSDTDFLKTKQPMSDDAIAPYDYQTGLVGDKAYNQIVYIKGVERAQRHLTVQNNQLVLNFQSGAEINIAEDLFEYIVDLFNDWNKWVEEGRFEIVKNDKGYYDLSPVKQEGKL